MKNLLAAIVGLAVCAGVSRAEVIWSINQNVYHRSHANVYMDTVAESTFGVWPVAWGHRAGAVYTTDGWQTVKWSNAGWLANVNNPFGGLDENWRVSMQGSTGGGYSPITFEYALYVVNSAGDWSWDNNRGYNHRITHYAYYR